MKTNKQRRHALDKTFFLESNREKWCLIFTVIGILTMICTAYGLIKDPAPFLTFNLSLGVTFILGASADSVMKAWKVDSANTTQTTVTTQNINSDKNVTVSIDSKKEETINQNINYNEHIIEEGSQGAPINRPYSQLAREE